MEFDSGVTRQTFLLRVHIQTQSLNKKQAKWPTKETYKIMKEIML